MCLLIATVAHANLYTVHGVSVAAEQESAMAARDIALSEGQVEAFNLLLLQLVGEDAVSQLPSQNKESVAQFVQDVSIEDEKLTATRYSGHITVRFNQNAVAEFFKAHEVPYLAHEAPSLLVIPVYQEGNSVYILDEKNPLYLALKQRPDFAPFYRATLPLGDANELALIEQALRTQQDLSLLAPLLATYQKDNILILRMRTEPLEQSVLIDTSIWPQHGMSSQTVFKRFRSNANLSAEAAQQMIQSVFETMERNWRSENMARLDEARKLYARIPVSSLQEWQNLETEMARWKFVDKVVVRGAYLPQMLVELSFTQSVDELKQTFAEYGWVLTLDFTGPGAALTRGVTYE